MAKATANAKPKEGGSPGVATAKAKPQEGTVVVEGEVVAEDGAKAGQSMLLQPLIPGLVFNQTIPFRMAPCD